MADKTWEDVLDFINGELPKDAVFNDGVYLRRLNIAIGIINSKTTGFEKTWYNTHSETVSHLHLVGSSCTFPSDLLEAHVVLWDDRELFFRTESQLQAMDQSWRTSRLGTPSLFTLESYGITLDSDPSSDDGGLLAVRGRGCIPELDLAPGSLNPFAYLKAPFQMAPAFHVLGYLPLYGRAREEVVAIQQDYRLQWESFLKDLEWQAVVQKYPDMHD